MTQGEPATRFLSGPDAFRALRSRLGGGFTIEEIGHRISDTTLIFKVWHTSGLDVYSARVRVRKENEKITFHEI